MELKVLRFFLVGSALEKEDPRDYDLMGVMEDDHFRAVFGMDGAEFMQQKKSGDWSKDMWKWKDQTIGAIRLLQALMPEKVPIDFKFIPESLLLEPNMELTLYAGVA